MRRLRTLLKTVSNWHWLKIILPFWLVVALISGLSVFSMDVLSSARAFVGGESLWSKAQKEAVLHLNTYMISRSEVDYRKFLSAIVVPLGDHVARLELDKPNPDFDVARKGLLDGRNHPEDIDGMIRLYRNFRQISFMHKAIGIWAEADLGIAELTSEASRLHDVINSGHADAAAVRDSLAHITRINQLLTPLEDEFSYSLGDASRKTQQLLLLATSIIALAIIAFGSYVSHRLLSKYEEYQEELRDLTAHAAAEQGRMEANIRIRDQVALLDKSRDAIIVRNINHIIVFWNKSAERLYGWTTEAAMGQPIQSLLNDDARMFDDATQLVLELGEWKGEVTRRRKDGFTLTVESRWTLVCDNDGVAQSILAIDTDITERKMVESDILHLAFHDPLTQLPNRLLFLDRLRQALANSNRSHRSGALLFIDLDHFKNLNDTRGHDQGDLLLQQVAERLAACVRDSDTVARLGGDEFVIMLSELSEHIGEAAIQAQIVGEKILSVLSQPYSIDGREYRSTSSIGLTLFNDHQKSVNDLMKQTDLAMYQAKAAGRNTFRFFNPGMQATVTARAALETDLHDGLRECEFLLHYQPQVNADGRVFGVEALVRWKHRVRGMISPAEFITLAEETGLILPLGKWVLETACLQLAQWVRIEENVDISIAVNVSMLQFRQPDFVQEVMTIIDETGANPFRLKLELTESLLVEDMDATIAKMSSLKTAGISFSLDDFGTGYSSLAYLKRLPLDQLKIDQSFVRDVLTDHNDAAIARTIIGLAQSLSLAVIAEGVETEQQRDFLAQHHCHAYQGYFFSRPLPIEQLETFMRDKNVGAIGSKDTS